ncbi:putative protein kinase RLK-Pelle-LRR-VIII-1 family [Helianthus debilis subsp. tardiflorus]
MFVSLSVFSPRTNSRSFLFSWPACKLEAHDGGMSLLKPSRVESSRVHISCINTNNFSEAYIIASWYGEYTLYRAELHLFDKENLSYQKGKYEGEHLKGQSAVVLKRYPSGLDLIGEEEFFTEIEILTRVKHPNIVNLLGFCVEDSEMVLVTENISNGYLIDYLGNVNNMRILTWEKTFTNLH